MNTNETDVLQIAIHSADRFPDESDKTGFYSNQTLYTILSDPIDSQPTQNFTPSWLPPDQITVDIYISSPVEAEEASPVLWRGDHVLSKTFQNVRNCELRTTFLLKVLRAARLELGEREPWCTLTDSGIPYTLSILGVEYVFQKPGSDSSDTYCLPFPISDEDRQRAPMVRPTRDDLTTRQTSMTLHLEFKVLKFQFPDNVLTPVSLQARSSMSVTPSPAAQPDSPNPNPENSFTLFKPTGLILERPPSPAEIPKGTIRPLPGHRFEQVEVQTPLIDPLNIKVEKSDPDELQIINHPAKKARRSKPSKRLVREVLSAIKEMQAEQSAPPNIPKIQSAALTEDVVQRDLPDRPRSDDVQRPKRRRISPPRPSPDRASRPTTVTTRSGYHHSTVLRRRSTSSHRHHGHHHVRRHSRSRDERHRVHHPEKQRHRSSEYRRRSPHRYESRRRSSSRHRSPRRSYRRSPRRSPRRSDTIKEEYRSQTRRLMEHHHQHPPAPSKQRTVHDLPIQPSPLRTTATTARTATSRQATPKRSETPTPAPTAQTTSTLPALEEEESDSSDSSDSEDDKDLMDF